MLHRHYFATWSLSKCNQCIEHCRGQPSGVKAPRLEGCQHPHTSFWAQNHASTLYLLQSKCSKHSECACLLGVFWGARREGGLYKWTRGMPSLPKLALGPSFTSRTGISGLPATHELQQIGLGPTLSPYNVLMWKILRSLSQKTNAGFSFQNLLLLFPLDGASSLTYLSHSPISWSYSTWLAMELVQPSSLEGGQIYLLCWNWKNPGQENK